MTIDAKSLARLLAESIDESHLSIFAHVTPRYVGCGTRSRAARCRYQFVFLIRFGFRLIPPSVILSFILFLPLSRVSPDRITQINK